MVLTVQADHRDFPVAVHTVVDVPVALVVHTPCRGAEADSHGPDCSFDHGHSQLLNTVADVPVVRSYRSCSSRV